MRCVSSGQRERKCRKGRLPLPMLRSSMPCPGPLGEAMKRREFITLLGSAAAIGPLAARAQEPKRRIGVLMSLVENDPEGQARVRAFVDALQQLGWTDGRNVRMDIRWTAGKSAETDKYAAELVALTPDVIFASASVNVAALQRITHSVPIVFANVIDPVGAGFVASLARPGGNTTGFSAFEYSLSGKWLELLKELAPNLTRVAVLRDPSLAAGIGQYRRNPGPSAAVTWSRVNSH